MLSPAKVERLLTDLSARARIETATIVAEEFVSGKLGEAEQRIAVDILAVLASDVEQQVREALADHVKDCRFLPAAIALTLARDLDPVAAPVLRFSPVLSDIDLIAIVRAGSTAQQIAVARREHVAAAVSDALIDTRKRKVVGAVLANAGAVLSESAFAILVDRYRGDVPIHLLLSERPDLPAAIAARLLDCASAEVAARLMLRDPAAQEKSAPARDRAFSRLLAEFSPAETQRLAADLHAKDMLPPSLLLRCLCDGHLFFVEAAMAARAGLGLAQARSLIHDRGPLGLPAVFARAALPEALLPAFRTALDAVRDAACQGEGDAPPLAAVIAGRLAETYPDLAPGDLDAMIGRLGRIADAPPLN